MAATSLLALVVFASFLGSWWRLLDLLSHFRLQLLAASVAACVLALAARSRSGVAIGLVLLVANAAPVAPYISGIGKAQGSVRGGLRVMTLNLHGGRTDPKALQALIQSENPEIILLTELPKEGFPLLSELASLYPYRTPSYQGSPFDVVLLSKWSLKDWSVVRSAASFLPVLTARLCKPVAQAPCVTLVGLHAARPDRKFQQSQLRAAAEAAQAAPDGSVILMGDLNLTPWSATFQQFMQESGLSGNPQVQGLAATWLSRFPLFGLMIDHVLTGPNMRMVRTRVGPDVGSDHFPVIAHLVFGPEG